MATKDKNKGFLSALKKAFNGGDVTPADPVDRADIVSLLVPACLLYVQASWGAIAMA
ncbi:hypothetical protein [Escherichia coli]|uniref:hypothetical protein n=1 Tax=Escherichia coli TaxID=562 RepID=UPI003518DC33